MQSTNSNNSSPDNSPMRTSQISDGIPIGPHNLRRIVLYSYRNLFLLKDKTGKIKKQLWIDRHTYRPTEIRDHDDIPKKFLVMKEYSAILGIINVLDCPFLLMVDDVQHVCTMGEHKIYTITSISFLPFELEEQIEPERKKILFDYIMYLRKLFSSGYYFSPTYDLTVSRMRRCQNLPQSEKGFRWNYELYREFQKFNIDPAWQVVLIQGFIGSFRAPLGSDVLEYFLISRRSCLNSGTRYHSRGIDDEAHVANFVETEQIVYFKGKIFSNIQIRGSAPIFWSQQGVQASIKLERTFALTNHIFLKHMKSLKTRYGYVICVNLMAKHKKEEQMITDSFEEHIKKNVLNEIGYEHFDFHAAVKGQKFENTNPLIAKLHPALESIGFCIENIADGNVEAIQQGVIRTNCLDCLDRTNYIQGKFAMVSLDLALEKMGVSLRNIFGQESFEELDNAEIHVQNLLMVSYKKIWAVNGDGLSQHYTGTGSVTSEVTRVGKKSLFGFLDHYAKSIHRFYNVSFEDNLKQDCIDFMLAKNTPPIFNPVNEPYEKEIRAREKEFLNLSQVSVYVVTWNLGGYVLDPNLDLKALFDFKGNPAPDIIVVGYQEYIELNASAVLSSTGKPSILLWIDLIKKTLEEHDTYILVSARDLVGLLMLVFVKETTSKSIMHVETDKVKTGIAGKIGNKGAVVVKLHVYNTSLCFVNCHLDPHPKKLDERVASLNDIHNKAFQEEGVGKRKKQKIQNLDSTFLFGDLNFRLNLGTEVKSLLKNVETIKSKGQIDKANEELKGIQSFDQLKLLQLHGQALSGYTEGQMLFLPTYKYDLGSDVYDTSKKQRVPAWTDRILWRECDQKIEQIFYDRVEYKISDHRPVVAYFNVQVKQIDKERKNKIIKEVYDIKDVEPESPVETVTLTSSQVIKNNNTVVLEEKIAGIPASEESKEQSKTLENTTIIQVSVENGETKNEIVEKIE